METGSEAEIEFGETITEANNRPTANEPDVARETEVQQPLPTTIDIESLVQAFLSPEETEQPPPVKKKRGRPKKCPGQLPKLPTRFGQCGNQLGEELFTLAFNDGVSANSQYCNNTCRRDSWFHHSERGKLRARAVLVDSESKVVSGVVKGNRAWSYNSASVVNSNSGGAGNNFALGYSVTGPRVRDEVMEALRRESERCDRLRSLFSIGSCAGGMGSGAGTFMLEQIRDAYPNKNTISVLVIPYFSGEVITQNNNMLFTLSKQNDVCEAVVVFENDLISNLITHQLRLKSAAFPDLNKVISNNLLSFLQPVSPKNSTDMYDLLSHLCPQPNYKFLSLQCFPLIKESKSKFDAVPSWTSVERDMIRFLKTSVYSSSSDLISSVASLMISRGEPVPDTCLVRLRALLSWPPWAAPPRHFHQSRPLLHQEKCLTVINNGATISGLLDACVAKAWRLYTNDMYTHHYYKFGFTKDDFIEAFVKSEIILKDYKKLKG